MSELLDRTVAFFVDNMPSAGMWTTGAPVALVWAWGWLVLAGHLKVRRGWRTGYTRKVFHFATFAAAAGCQAVWGTPAVCVLGSATSVVLLVAVLRGGGVPMYEALAREKDAPLRTRFIVVPYLATLIGGLASNVLFGSAASVGYLVAGMGERIEVWDRARFDQEIASIRENGLDVSRVAAELGL